MKGFIFTLFAGLLINVAAFSQSPQNVNHLTPSLKKSTSVQGDLLNAAPGLNFTGILYTRDGNIYYNQMDLTGSYGSESLIGTGIAGSVYVDASGKPHIVYVTSGKIGYRMHNGTAWTEEVLIESQNIGGTGTCSKPDIAVDGNGFAHVTYTDSHGSSGDDYTYPDIMYAVNTTGTFVKTLIYRGYRDYSSSGSWGADYFNKGSFIALNSNGDYFIISHKQNIWRWYAGTDNTYFVVVKSNLGDGALSNYGSDIFDIFDLTSKGNKIMALYKQSGFKTSELSVSGTSVSFTNTSTLTSSSVSSVATEEEKVVTAGKTNTNLYSDYNGLAHVYTDIVVKGTKASVTGLNNTYFAFYTDNADNLIKRREVVQPLSIATFSFAEQTRPAQVNIKEGTVAIEVATGTNRENLLATFTTSTDVASVKVAGSDQVSGTTVNNFTSPVTYVVVNADETSKNWVVTVTEAPLISNINEENSANIHIYPNPFSSFIMVENADIIKRITITNIVGQTVLTIEPEGRQMIHMDDLQAGIYLLNCELHSGEIVIRKLLKR